MSDIATAPLVLFTSRANAELGAQSIEIDSNGDIVLRGVVKKVTESMILSYPRTMLGEWTPNREAVRYSRDEISDRRVKRFDSGEDLDLDALIALAG